jgi:hypothetical protein
MKINMNSLDRRRFILYASVGLVAIGLSGAVWHLKTKPLKSQTSINLTETSHESSTSEQTSDAMTTTDNGETATPIQNGGSGIETDSNISSQRLDDFSNNMIGGGPPQDGIPPIEEPNYVSILEAGSFLEDNDIVFLVENGDPVKIFPQKILVWHEIVNETINGKKVSITYCPLTGSVIGYKGQFGEIDTTFGTSGKLLNSNLVMYDRSSESQWPQILGVAVTGSQRGKQLERFPVIWTTWKKARDKYPDAIVLSTETGFQRSYDRDPYGSYQKTGTYYDTGGPIFSIMSKDDRLSEKEIVIGIKIHDSELAIVKKKIARDKVANLFLNEEPIVAFYDDILDTVRTYSRKNEDNILNFELNNGIISTKDSIWNVFGNSIEGPLKGTQLKIIDSFDVMWFAWAAYYPKTEVYV